MGDDVAYRVMGLDKQFNYKQALEAIMLKTGERINAPAKVRDMFEIARKALDK